MKFIIKVSINIITLRLVVREKYVRVFLTIYIHIFIGVNLLIDSPVFLHIVHVFFDRIVHVLLIIVVIVLFIIIKFDVVNDGQMTEGIVVGKCGMAMAVAMMAMVSAFMLCN